MYETSCRHINCSETMPNEALWNKNDNLNGHAKNSSKISRNIAGNTSGVIEKTDNFFFDILRF